MAKPLGDQWGPGHRSGGTNTHGEHWPGLLIKFLGVAIPYADYYVISRLKPKLGPAGQALALRDLSRGSP